MDLKINSTFDLRSGAKMPVLGLGTWQLNRDTARIVGEAIKMGYRLIDTSGDYGTQPHVGEGLRLSGRLRSDIYLVTKVEHNDDAYQATRQDLKELGLSYADLMLIHRPPAEGVGRKLFEGLIRAKQEGLTRDIGVSNYSIDQIQALIDMTGQVPVVNQIEWSPFGHSKEMLGYCQENGIIIQAYSPLTRGERLEHPALLKIAGAHSKTAGQVLIRWNLQTGTVPILKANQLKHLAEDLNVFDFELSRPEMMTLDALNEEYSTLGKLPYIKH